MKLKDREQPSVIKKYICTLNSANRKCLVLHENKLIGSDDLIDDPLANASKVRRWKRLKSTFKLARHFFFQTKDSYQHSDS